MQVELINPAPAMDADAGDIVDLPEETAHRWVARGTAAYVDGPANDEQPVEDDVVVDELAEYSLGGGWFEINGEKIQGHDAALALLESAAGPYQDAQPEEDDDSDDTGFAVADDAE